MNREWPLPLAFLLAAATPVPATAAPDDPVPLGSRLEPLWDDALVASSRDVAWKLHPPVSREIVLEFDAPWEGWMSNYVSVFRDGDVVRMYYRGGADAKHRAETTCYAESPDGIRWTRPKLGLHEFQGSKDNNILLTGGGTHSFAPFRDDHPAAGPGERYKAVGVAVDANRYSALHAFASPDGIRWRPMRDAPILTKGKFDSLNTVFRDPVRNTYVCYSRDFLDGVRIIQRSESDDFLTWTDPVPLDYGGGTLDHLYTNAIRPYFRAPHVYVGMPMRFFPDRRVYPEAPQPGLSDAVFMISRDGLRWDRRFREGWIRPGPGREDWVDRRFIPAWGVVQTGEAELSVYWTEVYREKYSRLRRGVLRLDGFVSLNAPYAGGEFTTKPLTFEGKRLLLNVATSAGGGVRVEIQDAAGTPLEGYALDDAAEIYGSEVARGVRWKKGEDVAALAGKPVRLRFVMKDADLYAFKFE